MSLTTNTPNWKVYWSRGPGTDAHDTRPTREQALSLACERFPLYQETGDPVRIEGPNGEHLSAEDIKQHCLRQQQTRR
jgi:hypothetical protein